MPLSTINESDLKLAPLIQSFFAPLTFMLVIIGKRLCPASIDTVKTFESVLGAPGVESITCTVNENEPD